MSNVNLKKLYVDELKDLFSAENQLLKALPKMAKAASSAELRTGFEKHLEQTKGQVQRLEEIFQSLDESPKGKKCVGMEGLVKEGSEVMEEGFEDAVLDAGLIGAARRVEHYEIAPRLSCGHRVRSVVLVVLRTETRGRFTRHRKGQPDEPDRACPVGRRTTPIDDRSWQRHLRQP